MVFVGRPGKVCWGPRYVLVGSGRGEFRLVCAGCRRGRPAIGEGGLSGTPVALVGHPGTPLPDPRSTGSGRQASGSTTRNRSWGLRALIGYPTRPGCSLGIPGPRPAETRRGTCGCSRGASSAQRPSTNRTALGQPPSGIALLPSGAAFASPTRTDGGHVRRRWRDFPMLHGVDFGRSAFAPVGDVLRRHR